MRTFFVAFLFTMIPFAATAQSSAAAQKFGTCERLQQRNEHAAAADCFVEFFRDHPQDKRFADKALFNAAQCFEQVSEVGKAIQVRIMLVKAAPDSPLVEETVLDIAQSYHGIAVYAEAAKFYQLFAKSFPDAREAPSALANAVTLYAGLQAYEKAIAAGELYAKLFASREPERANELAFMVAEWLLKTGQLETSLNVYRDLAIMRTQPILRMRALAALGEHETSKEARLSALDEARRLYQKLDSAAQQKTQHVLVRVQLLDGESAAEDVATVKSASLTRKQWDTAWAEALQDAQRARSYFEEVVVAGRPKHKVAALVMLGELYESLARIRGDVPGSLTRKQDKHFRELLSADDPTVAAVATYLRAIDVAEHELVLGDDVRRARQRLQELDPTSTGDAELVPSPGYLGDGFQRSDIEKTPP